VLAVDRQSDFRPCAATSCISKAPATTTASLFASRMRLPARAAARVEFNPAAPTMAAITVSQ
jgi:hypothetical protein